MKTGIGEFPGNHVTTIPVHDGDQIHKAATKAEQALGAKAALANGLWVTLVSVSIRKALGSPPRFPYEEFAPVLEKIAERI